MIDQSLLPDKRSSLIRLAVADLEKCERNPRYVINMDSWIISGETTCSVCLAGSIMAQTLNMDDRKTCLLNSLLSSEYSKVDIKKFCFLNSLRYDLKYGYHRNSEQFKKELLEIAARFEADPVKDTETWHDRTPTQTI